MNERSKYKPYYLKLIYKNSINDKEVKKEKENFFLSTELAHDKDGFYYLYKVWRPGPSADGSILEGKFYEQLLEEQFRYEKFKKYLANNKVDELNNEFFPTLLGIAYNQEKQQKTINMLEKLEYNQQEVLENWVSPALTEVICEQTLEDPPTRTNRICELIEKETENKLTFVNLGEQDDKDQGHGKETLTTPLYLAIEENNVDVVKTLLKCGAKVCYEDPRVGHYNKAVQSVLKLIESNVEPTTQQTELHSDLENNSQPIQEKISQEIIQLVKLQSYIEKRTVESDLKWFKQSFSRAYQFFKPDPKYLPNKITGAVGFNKDTGFAEDVKETKLRLAEELKQAACDRQDPQQKLTDWINQLKEEDKKFINEGRLGELCNSILSTYGDGVSIKNDSSSFGI